MITNDSSNLKALVLLFMLSSCLRGVTGAGTAHTRASASGECARRFCVSVNTASRNTYAAALPAP